jgi:hypothetical protein
MPRETVYGLQHACDHDGVTIVAGELGQPDQVIGRGNQVPVVDVVWNREGTVQVVSKVQDADGGRWAGDYEQVPYCHFTDGMYIDLDRAGINDLIRKLRRARNQAFGPDE